MKKTLDALYFLTYIFVLEFPGPGLSCREVAPLLLLGVCK